MSTIGATIDAALIRRLMQFVNAATYIDLADQRLRGYPEKKSAAAQGLASHSPERRIDHACKRTLTYTMVTQPM